MIGLHNKTTKCGIPFRIYCTDAGGDRPVHGAVFNVMRKQWEAETWTADLQYDTNSSHRYDIVDVEPYTE